MPELQRLRIKVPIILVACKSDVRVANPDNLSAVRLLWSLPLGQQTVLVKRGALNFVFGSLCTRMALPACPRCLHMGTKGFRASTS